MKQSTNQQLRRARRILWLLPAALLMSVAPTAVTLVGDFQSELGCPSDSDITCTNTNLIYSSANDKWTRTLTIPAGSFSYKAYLNQSLGTGYGQKPGDTPIPIVGTGQPVKFYYDDNTQWVSDSVNGLIATLAGSFQSELGCAGDWSPSCLRSMLTDQDGDGLYTFSTTGIPTGGHEFKVAHDEGWDVSYGAGGGQNNIRFTRVAGAAPVTFTYVPRSHITFVTGPVTPSGAPTMVAVPGSMDSELGCSGDWDPACPQAGLTYSSADDVWTKAVPSMPAGSYEYKVALNGSWSVNYGAGAVRDGPNIPLSVTAVRPVKWYYDDKTHWVADTVNHTIYTAVGDFQKMIGCALDDDATCLRGWMQDPDADGTYDMVTPPIPPGTYAVQAATSEGVGPLYGDCGNGGAPVSFTVPAGNSLPVYFGIVDSTHCLTAVVGGRPKGSLRDAKAYWLEPNLIAWDTTETPSGTVVAELYHHPNAGLTFQPTGITGGTAITLTYDPEGMPAALRARYPHLSALKVFHFASGAPSNIKALLTQQLAVSMKENGRSVDATALQTGWVLDELYATAAKPVALGATWSGDSPTLRVWAPTAQNVRLKLYTDPNTTTAMDQIMTLDPATGVWSIAGIPAWKGWYYVYEVTVFTRATRTVVINLVPDPYSVDVSTNSQRSHLVSLEDASLKPDGWDALQKPALASPMDIVLYELHVRDFSATDATVPDDHKGKYLAFTDSGSDGMKHLRGLAQAGVTHVHLLPVFDIASVNEDSSTWTPVDYVTLRTYPPDAMDQQAYATTHASDDGFNWGYDPLLFGAPEGSYASDPNGGARVMEFRQMVQGLNAAGLRTVMDVVYNHTSSSGQNPGSVLDKIVPGYYHRLNGEGNVERSTCCENTATERAMMGKLTVDTLVTWARDFKVSGFRFDLMGHMPKSLIEEAQTALQAVDPSIYLYGEGWNFGEVVDNKQFVQAKQADMAGTGVGTFNDRIRDATRGGTPFTAITDQGFASGLLTEPNAAAAEIGQSVQRRKLMNAADLIRLSLAGNLRTYTMLDADGARVTGSQLKYNDNPGAGYTLAPRETINYVSAHDNMTVFDYIQVKAAAGADLDARVRYNNLALAIVILGQGIPFFHAGDEILRSKSGDTNSYNSGDWFNRVDWSLQSSTWGSGLPPQGDNQGNWNVLRPVLGNASLKPGPEQIQLAYGVFKDFLQIRKTEPLFRLASAAAIQDQVRFHNQGATQVPGLIVMELKVSKDADSKGDLLVIFNGSKDAVSWQSAAMAGRNFVLHPVQWNGTDDVAKEAKFFPVTGQLDVPGRTAVVFRQEAGEPTGLPPPLVPTCNCSTSGTNAALGVLALALAALWRRRRAGRLALVLLAAAAVVACGQAPASVVAVPFEVEITQGVVRPAGSTVGLVGNHTSLGATAAMPGGDPLKAFKLRQTPDAKWVGAAWLPQGDHIHYTVYMLNPQAPELATDGTVLLRTVSWTRAAGTPELARVEAFDVPTEVIRPCITFTVTVPANTPAADTIYIAGNDDQLGPWNPGKQALTKNENGTHGVRLCFDQGKALEYKYVRNGDWAYVEKNADGSERANRTLSITDTIPKSDTVEKWADL